MPAHRKWKPCTKTCETCDMTFLAMTGAAIRSQRFCSPSCRAEGHRNQITWTCEVCDKPRTTSPSKKRRFCSAVCRGVWVARDGITAGENNSQWTGGDARYWKQKARERDDFTCQVDGCDVRDEKYGTHAHHKMPIVLGGDDTLDNLITLCNSHHQSFEHMLIQEIVRRHPNIVRKIIRELYGG